MKSDYVSFLLLKMDKCNHRYNNLKTVRNDVHMIGIRKWQLFSQRPRVHENRGSIEMRSDFLAKIAHISSSEMNKNITYYKYVIPY
jgi:hypothetical protein